MKSFRLRIVIAILFLSPLAARLGLQFYRYNTEVPEGFERLSFAAFSEKAMINDADNQRVNPAIHNLDGKRLFVKGYMYPEPNIEGLTSFIICKGNHDVGFGPTPNLSELIKVRMAKGSTANIQVGLLYVAGEFRIRNSTKFGNLEPAFELVATHFGPSKTSF
ncbi:MAG: hypothetical protein NT013_21490 [Planctomycetia bacterium]|nr:hypothetical protein [Planctomycetia bacterium]